MPPTHPLVDSCIECGFCEPACPSRNLTLTPRQRIVGRREISRLQALSAPTFAEKTLAKTLQQAYDYAGIDTCAACGLCALRCPVDIDTGALTRALRSVRNRHWHWLAQVVANHLGLVIALARTGLRFIDAMADALGRTRFSRFARALHRAMPGVLPLWTSAVRAGTAVKPVALEDKSDSDNTVVYFPACPGRLLDAALSDATVQLLRRAGFQVLIPPGLDGMCCGMPFASKGFPDIASRKGNALLDHLQHFAGDNGLPAICDAAPCSRQLAGISRDSLKLYDAVDFIHDRVLPRLQIDKPVAQVALHITCSSQHTATAAKLLALARACAEDVIQPPSVTCCGFAGDKGFTLPALNASALARLRQEIPPSCVTGYSNSRTCEIGLSEHAGIPYRHIVYLLLEASALREKEK